MTLTPDEARVEEVRNKIDELIPFDPLVPTETPEIVAQKILNLKDKEGNRMIGIISPDQSKPEFEPNICDEFWAFAFPNSSNMGYAKGQQNMWDKNWRRLI